MEILKFSINLTKVIAQHREELFSMLLEEIIFYTTARNIYIMGCYLI